MGSNAKRVVFLEGEPALMDRGKLISRVIPALLSLQQAGFCLVPIFIEKSEALAEVMSFLETQGIRFEEALANPWARPTALVKFVAEGRMDSRRSFAVGADLARSLSETLNVKFCDLTLGWEALAREMTTEQRRARTVRQTKETRVEVAVALEGEAPAEISTGVGFFDHMLEQLAKHGGFGLKVKVVGDLHIDEHHTVEDTALAIGETLREALGDKRGIGRYGFVLPMDEAETKVSIDLSGRAYFVFEGKIPRESVGGLATELVPHFFRSLADALGATLHIEVRGDNAHHMIESTFKGLGRALRPALALTGQELPSTKGVL